MRIGKIELDVPVALAPMAGISDLPYRVICRKFGCGLTVSEMVSAKGLLYKNEKTFAMLRIDKAERPTAIQLFGSVPEELAEAARIVEARGADIIDFNMGCPVPKVVNNGEGSAVSCRVGRRTSERGGNCKDCRGVGRCGGGCSWQDTGSVLYGKS